MSRQSPSCTAPRCTRIQNIIATLALIAVTSLLLAGCGGLDDDDGGTSVGAASSGDTGDTGELTLAWLPQPDPVDGYTVYYGPSPEDTPYILADLRVDRGEVNASAPSVNIDPVHDLASDPSGPTLTCFVVVAYNDTESSSPSVPACAEV